MIKVSGELKLRGSFEVELDMTEDQFDNLPEREKQDHITASLDFHNWSSNGDWDDLDIYELDEI